MKLGHIALSTTAVLATLLGTTSNSWAVTFVNQALDILDVAPEGEPTFALCADDNFCTLGDTGFFTTGEGTAPNINNNLNDLGVPINKIVYQLLSPDAEWGTTTSNAFDITISEDRKTATYTGATLLPGQVYRINRTVSDGSPVDFSLTVSSSKSVPEPASVLGLLAFGAVGASLTRKKKQASR